MKDIKKFKNIAETIKYLEPNHILNLCLEKGGVAVKHPHYEYVTMPDGTNAGLSMSVNFTYYRGENKCFPSCRASLYRISDREQKIIELLKSYDFICFLDSLPEVKAFVSNNGYYKPWALAQHYEFATPVLDLTNELAVAVFFATHYYDRVCKQYLVMKNGKGRIRGINTLLFSDLSGPLNPVGIQPFARPERQDGYEYWMTDDDDFAKHSFVVEFNQDYDINMRLKTAVIGGENYYFPNEKLARMASIIKNTKAVTNKAISRMINDIKNGNSYISPEVTRTDIDNVIKKKNIFVVDAPLICPEAIQESPNSFFYEAPILVRPAYRRNKV